MQDISFKIQRAQSAVQRTTINQDSPWKLQQVQDAANHLQEAIHHIDNVDSSYNFKYVYIIIHILLYTYYYMKCHVIFKMKHF